MTGAEPPEDGYEGEYVAELAERIAAEGIDPADPEALGRRGVELMLEGVRATLERFGVRFDTWFSERDLYARGEVEAALARARRSAATPTASEDALWLRTTDFGDDKDRVLIRANGEPTYLAADVAYHWDKLRARLRPPDRRARRRPPRLRAADARGDRRRSAPTRMPSRR